MADEKANDSQPGEEANGPADPARESRRVFLSSLVALGCAEGLAAAGEGKDPPPAREQGGRDKKPPRVTNTPSSSVSHPGSDPGGMGGKTNHARRPNFAAYGFVARDSTGALWATNVHGRLHDPGSNKLLYHGHTLVQPCANPTTGFWIIQFLLAQYLSGPSPAGPFRLRLVTKDVQAGSAEEHELAVVEDVWIELPSYQFAMTYPANGETICTQFSAYGSTDPNNLSAVSASLSPGTGFSYSHVTPPPNWVLNCSAPGQTGATLTVSQQGTGGGSASASNLTITSGGSCGA
jgi:hypothetical protein